MRYACALPLLAALAAPLAAQQPATLEAHLADGGSYFSFVTNMPAYVAVFRVTLGSVTQLYPDFSGRGPVTGGVVLPGFADATFHDASYVSGYTMSPSTYVLVASRKPLNVGTPWSTPITIGNAMLQSGYSGYMNGASAIESLVRLVAPADPAAEVVTDELVQVPQRSMTYVASNGCGQSALLSAGPFEDGTLASPGGYLPAGGSMAGNGSLCASNTASAALAANRTKTDTLHADSSAVAPTAAARSARLARPNIGESRVITDPAAIRSFLSAVQDGVPARNAPSTSPHERVNGPAAGTGSAIHERTNGSSASWNSSQGFTPNARPNASSRDGMHAASASAPAPSLRPGSAGKPEVSKQP